MLWQERGILQRRRNRRLGKSEVWRERARLRQRGGAGSLVGQEVEWQRLGDMGGWGSGNEGSSRVTVDLVFLGGVFRKPGM